MSPDRAENAAIPTPEESGVIPTQVVPSVGAAALIPILPAGGNTGIQQSEIVAGIREAGSAFQTVASQTILARWAAEYDHRLTRCEEAMAEVRERLTACREERARLDERLRTISQQNDANDMLKIGGGAALALGLALLVEDKHVVIGGISTIAGLLLAYFGGARIPRWKRNG